MERDGKVGSNSFRVQRCCNVRYLTKKTSSVVIRTLYVKVRAVRAVANLLYSFMEL
jgi:hypothetical protein